IPKVSVPSLCCGSGRTRWRPPRPTELASGVGPLYSSPVSEGSFTAVTLALLLQRLRPHFEEHRLARTRARRVGTGRTEAHVHPSSCGSCLPSADGAALCAARGEELVNGALHCLLECPQLADGERPDRRAGKADRARNADGDVVVAGWEGWRAGGRLDAATLTAHTAGGATDERVATGDGRGSGTRIGAATLPAGTSLRAAVIAAGHRGQPPAAAGGVASIARRTTKSILAIRGEASRAPTRRIRHARRCPMVAVGGPKWTEDGPTSFRCWGLRTLQWRQLRALQSWWGLCDALPLTALLTTWAGSQLSTRSGTLRVGGIAEAAIHHFLRAPLEQAALYEDGTTTVSIEGARGVAHDTMGVVLTADRLTERRGCNRGGGGEEESKRDEELLHHPSLVGTLLAVVVHTCVDGTVICPQ